MSVEKTAEYGKFHVESEHPLVSEKSLADPEKSDLDKSIHTSTSNDSDFKSLSAWVKAFRAPLDKNSSPGKVFIPIWYLNLTLSLLKTAELIFVIVMEMRHGSWATIPWKYGITMRLSYEAAAIAFLAIQIWLFNVRRYPVWLMYIHAIFIVFGPMLVDRYSGMESPSWAYLKHLWNIRVVKGGGRDPVVWISLD